MNTQNTSPPAGYFTEFKIPAPMCNDKEWVTTLEAYWQLKYRDLYESPSRENSGDLKQCFTNVIHKLWGLGDSTGHKRITWVGVSLAQASLPTAQAYAPHDRRPATCLATILNWLQEGGHVELNAQALFSDVGQIGRPQALDESLLVFRNLLDMASPETAQTAALEILDDCFTGYAIFPGGDGKRDLFNWWLTCVVPAAFHLHMPSFIFTKDTPWPPLHG